jgi:excinuclease UvrABC nuclease subunit
MIVDELRPVPTNKSKFDFQGIRVLPETMGCYVLSNFHGEIIYIGLAINLKQRALQHFDNPDKHGVTQEGKAYWFNYVMLKSEKLIYRTERGWLNQYELAHGCLPPLNKIHSPVS